MHDSAAPPSAARVRADWRARGYGFEYWIDPPGQVWADFVHDRDELLMLLEGEIELAVGDRVLRPAVGEEVLIPAGARHTVRNPGTAPNRWCFGYRQARGGVV
jgi:mannose-6-phosphate isomerase-like protein (cupin superfamily)